MNKTKKRAIQKHRAKGLKFEARRKTTGQDAPSAMTAGSQRAKPAAASQQVRSRSSTGASTVPVEATQEVTQEEA